jgi:hypothetical protein
MFWASLLLACWVWFDLLPNERVPMSRAEEIHKSETDTNQIEALINQLAQGATTDLLADEGHRQHQEEMVKAWIKLRDLGPAAFTKLIEHLDDERLSFTRDSGSTDETWTVGRACFCVLWCNLEPYNKWMYTSSIPSREIWWRPDYCREFLDSPKKGSDWLAKHRDKSLVDLQIEALEWVTSNRSNRKVEISTDDKNSLLAELAMLKQSRKAIQPCVPWAL